MKKIVGYGILLCLFSLAIFGPTYMLTKDLLFTIKMGLIVAEATALSLIVWGTMWLMKD
jgi:hypothetical protein